VPVAVGRNQFSRKNWLINPWAGEKQRHATEIKDGSPGWDGYRWSNHLEARREAGLVEGPALLQAPRELLGRAEVGVHLLLLLAPAFNFGQDRNRWLDGAVQWSVVPWWSAWSLSCR
jgi:hypothetical protein